MMAGKVGRPKADGVKLEPDQIVSTKDLAALMGCTEVWINKLANQGCFEQVSRGRWKLSDVVQGYIEWLKDENRRGTKTATKDRLDQVKYDKLQLELELKRRDLVPLEDALIVMDTTVSAMKSRVMGIPAAFTRDLTERARLDGMLVRTMSDVSDDLQAKADALSNGDDLLGE